MTISATVLILRRAGGGGQSFNVALLFTLDQLIKIAPLAGGCLFLVDESKTVLIEGSEEFIPRDRLQRFLARKSRKIETNHTDVTTAPSRTSHARRMRAALLCPLPDFVVICGHQSAS